MGFFPVFSGFRGFLGFPGQKFGIGFFFPAAFFGIPDFMGGTRQKYPNPGISGNRGFFWFFGFFQDLGKSGFFPDLGIPITVKVLPPVRSVRGTHSKQQ